MDAMRPRVIPIVLTSDRYVVKTVAFKKPSYVGDPINTVRLFNEKQADELFIIDIDSTRSGKAIDFGFVEDVVSEAFMPVAYGGGISSMSDASRLFAIGVEKIVLNDACFTQPHLLTEVSARYGAQAIVGSVDVSRRRRGRPVVIHHGHGAVDLDAAAWARRLQCLGAGEILLTSMQREGCRAGLDLELISQVAASLDIPLVANGGADTVDDLAAAVSSGASAVAAGTMFTYHGPRKAVLIQYPNDATLNAAFGHSQHRMGGVE